VDSKTQVPYNVQMTKFQTFIDEGQVDMVVK